MQGTTSGRTASRPQPRDVREAEVRQAQDRYEETLQEVMMRFLADGDYCIQMALTAGRMIERGEQ